MKDILEFVEKFLVNSDRAPWAILLLISIAFVAAIVWMITVVRKLSPASVAEMLKSQANENAQRIQDQSIRHSAEIQTLMKEQADERKQVMERHVEVLQQNSIAFTRFSETVENFQGFLREQRAEMSVNIENAVANGFASVGGGVAAVPRKVVARPKTKNGKKH